MNTFKAGDRVIHAQYGAATVVGVEYEYNLINIRPDNYPDRQTAQVHPISLTHEPKPVVSGKIKIGDRVSHRLHRDGTVEEIDLTSGLYTVSLGGSRAYRALEHQIEPAQPEPTFAVTVAYPDAEVSYTPITRKGIETFLTEISDWGIVDSIIITRAKG